MLLDRSFDMVTPLIHDYQYQSTVFDYLPVPENGSLESVIKGERNEKNRELNEKDEIWQKYKSSHIAEVIGSLNEEIKVVLQEQKNMKKYSNSDNLHQDDIRNILKKIPEIEKRQTEVVVHLDLSKQVTDIMANPAFNIMKLIEFEQTVISGVNDHG